MFFTQEDYRKIYDWIKVHSIKDSEFSDSKPLNGGETITVVQQGHNVKLILQDFLEQLALLNIPDFVNVTERYDLIYISLFEATKAVPYGLRKIGQVITFLDEDGNWKIYQFRGEKRDQWNILTLWVDILEEIIGKSSIIPDEEDLTAVKEGDKTVVKFKDKAYNPDNFSGKGRVYLRKNITQVVDPITHAAKTVNFLTQSMIGKENAIYIIQYDYDLNGQTITIPSGSTLLFEGGSINNGTIKCTDNVTIQQYSGNAIIDGDYIANEFPYQKDEEDIYMDDDLNFKLSDKKYNPANFSGLGRVYLRKNIVDDKNILTQGMINQPNTEYIIQYDFDLNKETITIPEGCILKFEGGSFSNGIIIRNNTILINPNFKSLEYRGTENNIDISKIVYNTNGQEYPAFPKLNKGKYIITSFSDTTSVKQVTINGYDNNNSVIYSFKIKSTNDGYTQVVDISDYPDDLYRFAVASTNKYIFKINQYTHNSKVLKVYDTFEDMNNDDTLVYGDICYIKGYYKKYDDGDGFWTIENISSRYGIQPIVDVIGGDTGAAKSYLNCIHKILNNGLRAILICKNKKIDVVKLGVKNNGEETTKELQNIIDNTADGDVLYFQGGRYYFESSLNITKDIILEGETKIGVASSAISANSSPYWQSNYNNSIIQAKDNGNSYTIFRFNLGENTDKYCINVTSDKSIQVNNIIFTNNSFDFEGQYGGLNLTPPKNPLTPIVIHENIGCINRCSRAVSCIFIGFSGYAIGNIHYGYIHDIYFHKCNICMYSYVDTTIDNIRATSCVTIAEVSHLNQVSNVRGDSIKGPVFIVRGSSSVFNNIEIDYCLKSCFELTDRCNNITINSNCCRVQVNSWNNDVDNSGKVQLDECFIHVSTKMSGLKLNICLVDGHATDAGSNPNYNKHIMYPCILGIENDVDNLNAIIDYNGNLNLNNKQYISINRLIQSDENHVISGRILSSKHIYLLDEYNKNTNNYYIDNYIYSGDTIRRPSNPQIGCQYFDTTLNKPIWWTGMNWVDSTGVSV